MIYFLFVIFIVIASLLMLGIVLIQESKGGSGWPFRSCVCGTTDFFLRSLGFI